MVEAPRAPGSDSVSWEDSFWTSPGNRKVEGEIEWELRRPPHPERVRQSTAKVAIRTRFQFNLMPAV